MPNQDPYVFGTRGTGINYRKKLWYLTEKGKNNREIKILGLENNLYVLILTDGSGSATEVHGFASVPYSSHCFYKMPLKVLKFS